MNAENLHRRCLDCSYILDGLPKDRCPECGRVFDPANPTTFVMDQSRGHPVRSGMPYLVAVFVGIGMIACSIIAHDSADSLSRPRRDVFVKLLGLCGAGVVVAVLCVGIVAFLYRPSGRGDYFYAALKIAGGVILACLGFFLSLWVLWSR